MGSGGHNKKPTKLKIIQGTFRDDRAPKNEPKPPPVLDPPRPPAHLTKYGKKLWKALAEQLVDQGLLTGLDIPALEICCDAYGLYREAKEAVLRPVDPETGKRIKQTLAQYMNGRNSQTMPEYTAMTKAFNTFKSYLAEFGLAPAARSKFDLPDPKGNEEDPMERLFNEM